MSHRKVHSQGNVPFSWEDSPGVSKFSHHEVENFQLHDLNISSSLSSSPSDKRNSSEVPAINKVKIPPPPCGARVLPRRSSSAKGSLRRQEDDPFFVAYKECTKSAKRVQVLPSEGRKIVVGAFVRKTMFAFTCKRSCDVRDDSLVRLPRLPPLPGENSGVK